MAWRYGEWLYAVVLLSIGTVAGASDLEHVRDAELKNVVANFEVLAERRELPYHVRILGVAEHGECDGSLESCPQMTAYISVSTFDEAPDEAVYRLPKSYGWEFIKWVSWPSVDGPKQFASFLMTEKSVVAEGEGERQKSEFVEIRVNPWAGSIHKSRSEP